MTVQNVVVKNESAEIGTVPSNVNLAEDIWSNVDAFMAAQRMAKCLSSMSIVPRDYQNNVGNCIIALEMANRIHTSPIMVMQNLYVVNGRPAWSSQYIIAMINSSKKYKTELQYKITGSGDDLNCYAYVEDYNGHVVTGPVITMKMAKDEGWYGRNGSKWKTMPEVMIRYRAASFFGRLNCPDMIMGFYSVEEAVDMEDGDFVILDETLKAPEKLDDDNPKADVHTVDVSQAPDEPKKQRKPRKKKDEPVQQKMEQEQVSTGEVTEDEVIDPRDTFFGEE